MQYVVVQEKLSFRRAKSIKYEMKFWWKAVKHPEQYVHGLRFTRVCQAPSGYNIPNATAHDIQNPMVIAALPFLLRALPTNQ